MLIIKRILLLTGVLALTACTSPSEQQQPMMDHQESASSSQMSDSAKERLMNSPRHQEWVDIQNGEKTIHAFVVYPERSTPAPVVVLIHENRGLNDWARAMADEIAAKAGYIVIAPDLLSSFSAEITRTSDFADEDAAIAAISTLTPDSVQSDLQAVLAWAKSIPAANDTIVSAGFCWGGSQSFALATAAPELSAALVFYGSGPKDATLYSKIKAPVFGFYGGADDRINATIEGSKTAMTSAGKAYEPVIYDGAGHAFMRLGEDPNGTEANQKARNAAWERMKNILSQL